MNVSLADKLKELRKSKNVSQEKFAEYLGVSYQAISKWENRGYVTRSCDSTDWLICNQQVEFDRYEARFLLGRAFAIVMTYLIILLLNSIFS